MDESDGPGVDVAVANHGTARARAVQPEVAVVVTYLREQLGERLTAVVAGVSDASVIRAWAAGNVAPEAGTEQTLRAAYEVAQLLLQKESSASVQLWFSGMNPELDDQAPSLVIAKDPARVLSAARFCLAHG